MNEEAVPLYSYEAEQGILGGMILWPSAFEEALAKMVEGDFYRPAHRLIFRAFVAIESRKMLPDFIVLIEELSRKGSVDEVGGENYLIELAEYAISSEQVPFWIEIVLEKSRLRECEKRFCEGLRQIHSGAKVEEIQAIASSFETLVPNRKAVLSKLSDGNCEREGTAVSTGWKSLDKTNSRGGYPSGQLTMMCAETGHGKCLGGETVIETDRGPVRVDVLWREGEAFNGYALNEKGERVTARIESPFVKGIDDLYEVSTSDDRKVVVTQGHQFLSSGGWVSLSRLAVGCTIGGVHLSGSRAPGESSEGTCLSAFLEGVGRSTHRVLDFRENCQPCCHSCGEPSQRVQGSDLECAPFLADAHERSLTSSCAGGMEHGSSDTRQDQHSYHPSKRSSLIPGFHGHSTGCHSSSSPSTLFESRNQDDGQSRIGYGLLPSYSESNQPVGFPSCVDCTITSIRFLRRDIYFDVSVPVHENYLAGDLWNHNSTAMLTSAIAQAESGKRILYATFADIDRDEILRRAVKMLMGWGKRPDKLDLIAEYDAALFRIHCWDFDVYDSSESDDREYVETFAAYVKNNIEKYRWDVIYIDYAQELVSRTSAGKTEVDNQNTCARCLGRMAAKLRSVPVIVGAQITLGGKGAKDAIAYSKVWEQVAGWILRIRPEGFEVIKSRFKGMGSLVPIQFNKDFARYDDRG
jgi:replicative DNA helicase